MGNLIQQGWIPRINLSGSSTSLDIYFSEYKKFNIADTRIVEAEMPLNGNRDFKYLGDHAEFILRVHIWKHDSLLHSVYGYTAQTWHDAFIQNFYQRKINFKTNTTNQAIKGKDGAVMEFMSVGIEYEILDTPERETVMDISIVSLEYIDQTKISVAN